MQLRPARRERAHVPRSATRSKGGVMARDHLKATWTAEALKAGMRALVRTVAPAPAAPLPEAAGRLVAALQSYLGTHFDVAALPPIGDRELASRMPDPWMRQQL